MDDRTDRYQELGAIVLSQCPADDDRMRLKAELDYGWAQLDLRSWNSEGTEFRSPLEGGVRTRIYECLSAIRDDMAEPSGEKWTTCTFTVDKDRKFNLSVAYGDPGSFWG